MFTTHQATALQNVDVYCTKNEYMFPKNEQNGDIHFFEMSMYRQNVSGSSIFARRSSTHMASQESSNSIFFEVSVHRTSRYPAIPNFYEETEKVDLPSLDCGPIRGVLGLGADPVRIMGLEETFRKNWVLNLFLFQPGVRGK